MPGAWLWLFIVSVIVLLAFAIVFELTGPRWYTWTLLGIGLLMYFFAVVMYVFRGRKRRCADQVTEEAEEDEEEDEYVPPVSSPLPPKKVTAVLPKKVDAPAPVKKGVSKRTRSDV